MGQGFSHFQLNFLTFFSRKMRALKIIYFPVIILVLVVISQFGQAQHVGVSPAPTPTSDGFAIDQGIAYILMLVALAITYIFH
ncbi:hypothetical protein L6164_037281 [Bauhinia variegata]|uniref:Uncharacterized protein n=1 Tax=Bauhinia variegata TaxID=167791 RepID=A0ACB9KJM4_BAUVA|nr:hypothetical protein L6164_037281 [Bauhinia variegata]